MGYEDWRRGQTRPGRWGELGVYFSSLKSNPDFLVVHLVACSVFIEFVFSSYLRLFLYLRFLRVYKLIGSLEAYFSPFIKLVHISVPVLLFFISSLLLQKFIWSRISLFLFESRRVNPTSDLRDFVSAYSDFSFSSRFTVQQLAPAWIILLFR